MASIKNTNRNKRKYSEKRRAKTERNRQRKKDRYELRAQIMAERSEKLLGQKVIIRTADGPQEGIVREIATDKSVLPSGIGNKSGRWYLIRFVEGELWRPRRRLKVLRNEA